MVAVADNFASTDAGEIFIAHSEEGGKGRMHMFVMLLMLLAAGEDSAMQLT